jgi:hypothetical protein
MILPRRLRAVPLLLTLLLVAGPLAAATYRPREEWQSRLSVTGLVSDAWALVSRIWGKAGLTDPFGKSGSSSDPFGKSGSSIDPFGNPAPSSQLPSGSTSAATPPVSGS